MLLKKIQLNPGAAFILIVAIIMLGWWFFINLNNLENTTNNFLYGAAIGLLPIIAFLLSLKNIQKWGGWNSTMGRALIFLSFGLFTWGTGTLIFAYYNLFLEVELPYPSLADAAYIISWPLWAIGIIYMSRITGAKFQFKKISGRITFLVIPLVVILISYFLFFVIGKDGMFELSGTPLKIFFDIAYPLGDIVILTVTSLVFFLSLHYLGGFFKWPILLILAGFIFNYFGDFSFVYTVTKETFFVAGWVDLLYTIAFFLLGFGINLMDPTMLSKEEKLSNL